MFRQHSLKTQLFEVIRKKESKRGRRCLHFLQWPDRFHTCCALILTFCLLVVVFLLYHSVFAHNPIWTFISISSVGGWLSLQRVTRGGPMIMPLQRVRVMSSSSSSPQLTVPSPTPFWPSSSSSSRRKLRGTFTPDHRNTHHDIMKPQLSNIKFRPLKHLACFIYEPQCLIKYSSVRLTASAIQHGSHVH